MLSVHILLFVTLDYGARIVLRQSSRGKGSKSCTLCTEDTVNYFRFSGYNVVSLFDGSWY